MAAKMQQGWIGQMFWDVYGKSREGKYQTKGRVDVNATQQNTALKSFFT